jgi:predicted transcriptional regulator
MNRVKEQVISLVSMLPDNNLTIEDIIEELYFKMQVDQGLAELDAGQGIPHSEVKKRMAKWLKE